MTTKKPEIQWELLNENARVQLIALIQPSAARFEDIEPKFELLAELMTRGRRPDPLIAGAGDPDKVGHGPKLN